ncbi:hypothetical protein AJ79_01689 [Helicocarpus griseus UAMH5409]|uniref:DNA replication regulator SLD2 n=1 Tax=Helicocarpus griseus UAMH5409 TaxID=1447875 RepID=A0A2B7Y6C1_9EURO|nr:hypothetical protein AJ79_01689 [Helicocarpus griseus UAMH5409]
MQHPLGQDSNNDYASTIRAELKEWERSFSAANGGRKPGRDDIKNDPTISSKYKTYSRLRAQSSQSTAVEHGEPAPSTKSQAHSQTHQHKKRKRPSDTQESGEDPGFSTPRKACKHILATPSKHSSLPNSHPSQLDPYDSPSSLRKLFSPSSHYHQESQSPQPLRAAIGPTPQRDGKALGLFDLLSASGGSARSGAATPCSRRKGSRQGDNTMQTPSRKRSRIDTITEEDEEAGEEESPARAKTPASSAKKFYLANFFATPPAYRYSNAIKAAANGGNGSGNRLAGNGKSPTPNAPGSETPSFLRRRNLFATTNPTQQHAGTLPDISPVAVRMPQKLVGRGLSAIVQGLRDIQEERLDEDLDMLREMEAEQRDNVVITDSQGAGGGNGGVDEPDADGSPAKTRKWKKKGQKRTTRRVIMRPVRKKPKVKEEPEGDGEGDYDGEEGSEDELAAVLETQPTGPSLREISGKESKGGDKIGDGDTDNDDPDLAYASDLDVDSDPNYEDIAEPPSPSRTKSSRKKPPTPVNNAEKKKQAVASTTAAVKPGRKIKPEAHANYRALKIRSRGSAGRGRMGRFGRRR